MKKILYLILTISWMSMIFMFSSQEASSSTDLSNSFINSTIIKIYRLFDLSRTDEEVLFVYSVPVRKLAHFSIYLILGVLVSLLFNEHGFNTIHLVILFCMFYACTDEIHQAFVVGRSCELRDVLIDTLGSMVGAFVVRKFDKFF